jgi:hypothetical protein
MIRTGTAGGHDGVACLLLHEFDILFTTFFATINPTDLPICTLVGEKNQSAFLIDYTDQCV